MLEGFAHKEIAAIVGITEGNVGVKINRFKAALTAQRFPLPVVLPVDAPRVAAPLVA